jgi:hypothetical protein
MIQEQMDALADTKSVGEERYARAKQENATLQARILMLEEAAKDAETRAEERLQVSISSVSRKSNRSIVSNSLLNRQCLIDKN